MAISVIKGRQAALDWLKGLKQFGRSYNGNRIATTAVENGEIAMALSNNYYWYSLARERGGPDKLNSALYSFPGNDPGNIYNVSAAGILKSSKNQELAQRFLAFMVAKPAQGSDGGDVGRIPGRAGCDLAVPAPAAGRFHRPGHPGADGQRVERRTPSSAKPG